MADFQLMIQGHGDENNIATELTATAANRRKGRLDCSLAIGRSNPDSSNPLSYARLHLRARFGSMHARQD
jgi:hypothetical protein